jgi:DNA-binding GntR family transcriptional regulator
VVGAAAARAAVLRSEVELARLAAAAAAFRNQSALSSPDLAWAVGLNKEFHFAVYAAAGSPLLSEIIRGLWLKAGPVINLDLRANPERLRERGAIRFHANVLAAIKARDGASARAGIAADIQGAADFIIARGGLAN